MGINAKRIPLPFRYTSLIWGIFPNFIIIQYGASTLPPTFRHVRPSQSTCWPSRTPHGARNKEIVWLEHSYGFSWLYRCFFFLICRRHGSSSSSMAPKIAILDFSHYNGSNDPTSWIYCIKQFFKFQSTLKEDKVTLADYHLDGDIINSLKAQLKRQLGHFLNLPYMDAKYGPMIFENHFANLTKLKQVHWVREYQNQFEQQLTRVGYVSSNHQIGCFISGLKYHIHIGVQAIHPTLLMDANWLARPYKPRHFLHQNPLPSLMPIPSLPYPSLSCPKKPLVKKLNVLKQPSIVMSFSLQVTVVKSYSC